jgi:hypothetical protein
VVCEAFVMASAYRPLCSYTSSTFNSAILQRFFVAQKRRTAYDSGCEAVSRPLACQLQAYKLLRVQHDDHRPCDGEGWHSDPPLPSAEAVWADQWLRQMGLR